MKADTKTLETCTNKILQHTGCVKHAHSAMCICTRCRKVYCYLCHRCECSEEEKVNIPKEKPGTTGKVDWSVRITYNMLNKSPYKDGAQEFTIGFSVVAETVKEAWEEALKMFQEEMTFDKRVYGRTEMSVKIES